MPEVVIAMITGEEWCGPGPQGAAEGRSLRATGFAMYYLWGVTERGPGCHRGLAQSKDRL